MVHDEHKNREFPISAGILLGLGLGGFFDGIILHQVLQWHHMLTSAGYPADSVQNLEVNTLWDGLFHSTTYIFVLLGLIILWRTAHRTHVRWSSRLLWGTMLIGFGLFNLIEGIIDHQLLGIGQRNRAAGSLGLLGPRFPRVGCADAYRWVAAHAGRTTRSPGTAHWR
jgi:uncharacterized membrane protein